MYLSMYSIIYIYIYTQDYILILDKYTLIDQGQLRMLQDDNSSSLITDSGMDQLLVFPPTINGQLSIIQPGKKSGTVKYPSMSARLG